VPGEELTPEQIADAIRGMKVSDLLLSTVTTLAEVGFAKMSDETKDLPQAQLAVDAIGLLLPKLDGFVSEELLGQLRQMLAQLQIAYTQTVAAEATNGEG
jgi:hypothetical protein